MSESQIKSQELVCKLMLSIPVYYYADTMYSVPSVYLVAHPCVSFGVYLGIPIFVLFRGFERFCAMVSF